MKQIIIAAIAMLLPGLLSAGELQTLKMKIDGMTCGQCEAKVKKQLASLCKEITIDLERGEGVCRHEALITTDQILSEANKTGFKTSKLN